MVIFSNLEKVSEGSHALRHGHLGPFHIAPAHRHLHGPQAKLLGDHEIFNVETEAVLLLTGKHLFGRIGAIKLESALGIVEGQARQLCASPD